MFIAVNVSRPLPKALLDLISERQLTSKLTAPNENSPPMARVCHLVGPGGLPETGLSLFRPCGLRAKGARLQMLLGSHLLEPPARTRS